MYRKRITRPALFLLLVPFVAPEVVADKDRPFVDEDEAPRNFVGREAWKEAKVEIPPSPRDQDLIRFHVDDPERDFTYAIDKRSLRIDKDQVVRYTLVIESRHGVRNYAYEGLRCHSREYKVYAYGSNTGKLRPRRDPKWKAIKEERFSRVHRDLHRYYLCEPSLNKPLVKEEIILALKGVTNPRDINFLKAW